MCLALASPALIGVGRIGGFSFLSFPEMSVTVVILPYEFLEYFFLRTHVQLFPFA